MVQINLSVIFLLAAASITPTVSLPLPVLDDHPPSVPSSDINVHHDPVVTTVDPRV
jgi:hypothetical protein